MDRIDRETRVAAPPQRVWDVLTRPEHLSRWFASGGAEIDLRPGGLLVFVWPEHGRFLGRVEEVREPEVFAFRWAQPPDVEPVSGNSSLVRFTLTPDGDGTLLRVVESGFVSPQHRAENEEGWRGGLAELAAYAADLVTG